MNRALNWSGSKKNVKNRHIQNSNSPFPDFLPAQLKASVEFRVVKKKKKKEKELLSEKENRNTM